MFVKAFAGDAVLHFTLYAHQPGLRRYSASGRGRGGGSRCLFWAPPDLSLSREAGFVLGAGPVDGLVSSWLNLRPSIEINPPPVPLGLFF